MSTVSLDPQASAWRDDGTESGVLRTEVARGDALFMPFHSIEASVSPAQSLISNQFNHLVSLTGLHVELTASATLANPCLITLLIAGQMFGLCYVTVTGSGVPGVMIDGIAYPVPASPWLDPRYGTPVPVVSQLPGEVIATDLGPGLHVVDIVWPNHVSEDRAWYLWGYLVDRQAGYLAPDRAGVLGPNDSVAVSATGWTGIGTNTGLMLRKVFWYNSTASAIQVTFARSSDGSQVVWSNSVPAHGTLDMDFGLALGLQGYGYAQAAATGIIATSIGGN